MKVAQIKVKAALISATYQYLLSNLFISIEPCSFVIPIISVNIPYITVSSGKACINHSDLNIQNIPKRRISVPLLKLCDLAASSGSSMKYLKSLHIPIMVSTTPAQIIIPDVKPIGFIRRRMPIISSIILLKRLGIALTFILRNLSLFILTARAACTRMALIPKLVCLILPVVCIRLAFFV